MRHEKPEAISMRLKGSSYNEISKRLGVPKSTLSYWFRNLLRSDQITRVNKDIARKVAARNMTIFNKRRSKTARLRWKKIQKESMAELSRLSRKDLFLIGVALYWAEGYKRGNWSVIFCNSDPTMIKLIMRYFREICSVPETKFRVQVQIYKNMSLHRTLKYWSSITQLPLRQFMKPIIQVSRVSKFRRGNTLPYGTIRVRINDVILVNRIKGWISALAKM